MTLFALIRHMPTEWNAAGVLQVPHILTFVYMVSVARSKLPGGSVFAKPWSSRG